MCEKKNEKAWAGATNFDNEVGLYKNSLSPSEFIKKVAHTFVRESGPLKWTYNFAWMGLPAIQMPTDAWALQEIIWETKPDLIIETGIAHGGSLAFYASMLALLDLADSANHEGQLKSLSPNRKVVGIDIEIKAHNRKAIASHPLIPWIEMIEGSSVSTKIIDRIHLIARDYKRVLLCLDSNHSHSHVLQELIAYAPLVSVDSYCVVFDTAIEDMPASHSAQKNWGPGNNPRTAIREYLKENKNFFVDTRIQDKLLITVAPNGFLKRVS